MVLALHLPESVTHRFAEIFIGVEDGAVELEFNHRLRLADGIELTLKICTAYLLLSDVSGVFDDLERRAVSILDRVIGRLNPDLPAVLAETLVLTRVIFTAVQLLPELTVLGARRIRRFGEHAVMLALHLLQGITHRFAEVFIGVQDGAVEFEFNHRLRLVNRSELTLHISQPGGINTHIRKKRFPLCIHD